MLTPISQAHYMSHTDLHQVHGMLTPISQAHYMSHTEQIRKAMEEER